MITISSFSILAYFLRCVGQPYKSYFVCDIAIIGRERHSSHEMQLWTPPTFGFTPVTQCRAVAGLGDDFLWLLLY